MAKWSYTTWFYTLVAQKKTKDKGSHQMAVVQMIQSEQQLTCAPNYKDEVLRVPHHRDALGLDSLVSETQPQLQSLQH